MVRTVDNEDKVDPELEEEIKAAGDAVTDQTLETQAKYLFKVYASFLKSRIHAQAFVHALTILHYQSIIGSL